MLAPTLSEVGRSAVDQARSRADKVLLRPGTIVNYTVTSETTTVNVLIDNDSVVTPVQLLAGHVSGATRCMVLFMPPSAAFAIVPQTSDPSYVPRKNMPTFVTPDTGWTALTLVNSWVNYDLGTVFNSAAYRKDRYGWVHLKGLVRAGTAQVIGTLPAGYRTVRGRHLFLTVSNSSLAYIQISLDGSINVIYGGSGSNAYVTLDGIMFPTWDNDDLRLQPDYGTTINSFGSDLTQDQDAPAWYYDAVNKHVYGMNQIYAGSFSGSTIVSRHAALLPVAKSQSIYAVYNMNGATATWMEWRANGDSFGGNTLFQNQGNPVTFAIPKMIIWPTQEAAKLYTAVTFANSWTDYLSHERQFGPCGYYKDYEGRVHLKGLIKQTSGTGVANISGNTLPSFTLPAGYRPGKRCLFPSFGGNSFARTDVLPDGTVIVETGNQSYHSLAGIYFYAEN